MTVNSETVKIQTDHYDNRIPLDKEKIFGILIYLWLGICTVFYLALSLKTVYGFDESYTVSMISHSFSDIIKITSEDVHSPFYYFLVKLFSLIPGIGVLRAPKLFSCICALVFLYLGQLVTKRRYSAETAFFFIFISSLAPMMLDQVCNGRMYTPGLLSVSMAIYEAYMITEDAKRSRYILLFISSVVSIWLQHVFMTMMIFMYIIFIIMMIVRKDLKNMLGFLCTGALSGLTFVPWLFVLLDQFGNKNDSGTVMHSLSDRTWFISMFRQMKDELFSTVFYTDGWLIRFRIIFYIITVLLIVFYFIRNIRNRKTDKKICDDRKLEKDSKEINDRVTDRRGIDLLPALGPVITVLTFFLTGGFLLMYSGQFFARYVFPAFGGMWLMAAVAMTCLKSSAKLMRAVLACFKAVVIAFSLFFGIKAYHAQYSALKYDGIEKFREVMECTAPGDVVMFSDTWSSMMEIYVPDRNYWIFGFKDRGLPFDYEEVYTDREQLDETDTVWIVGNTIIEIANLDERFKETDRITFDHHEYHFIIKKYEKI